MCSLNTSSLRIALIPFSSSGDQSRREIPIYKSLSVEKKLLAFDFSQGNPTALRTLAFSVRTRTRQSPKSLTFGGKTKLCAKTDAELVDFVEKHDILTPISHQNQVFLDFDSRNEPSIHKEENLAGLVVKEECEASNVGDFNLVVGSDEVRVRLNEEKENGEDLGREKSVPDDVAIGKANGLKAGDIVKKIMSLPVEARVKVLDLFCFDDRSLTISDYNDILRALVRAGEYEMVIILFSELPSRGVKPDAWSFSLMIQSLCKKRQPEEAKYILDDMMQSGFSPNVVTFTTLVNCLCSKGKLKKAFEVFETMKQVGCEPEVRTYNCLIYGLCYVGRLEEALELLKKIKRSFKSPDIYTYTLVIDAFCKVGRSDEAMELLRDAQDLGLMPNVIMYNALLNGYCKEGRPLDGLRLLKDMQRELCLPDLISYSTLLPGLLKWGEVSAAWRTYKEMKDAGFQAEDRTVNTLFESLCRQSRRYPNVLIDAEELFQTIIEMNYRLSPYAYCLIVEALAEGGKIDEALFHLHEMLRTDYYPRMMTYNIVVRVLCARGRVDDAMTIIVQMIERGITPSSFSFQTLLREFRQQGRLLDASGVYAAAVKQRVPCKFSFGG